MIIKNKKIHKCGFFYFLTIRILKQKLYCESVFRFAFLFTVVLFYSVQFLLYFFVHKKNMQKNNKQKKGEQNDKLCYG